MWRRLLTAWRGWDGTLLVLTVSFLVIGLAALYSISLSQPQNSGLFGRQLIGALLGFILMVVISTIDYRAYRSWSRLLYVLGVVLLVLVLIIGHTARGATGWIRFGAYGFQPVEVVKYIWLIALASYLTSVGPPLTWKKTLVATLLLAPLLLLVLVQPDFGSGSVLIAIWGVLLAAMPKPKKWWMVMGGIALVVVAAGSFFLKGYQRDRINTFLNPQADPLGRGYNITQSIIAVGSGSWWGRGFALGTQSQLHFLPEQHTDFIFASIAEEFGLVGAGLVLLLWVAWLERVVWLIRRLRDDFSVLVAVGIFTIFSMHLTLNIAMNMGFAPIVGLPLPFLSFGSSSLVMSLAAVGILQNMARESKSNAPYDAAVRLDRV